MTWTTGHAEWWKSILETDNGKSLLEKLRKMRPLPTCGSVEHQAAYVLGAVSGHEQCQSDLINLAVVNIPKAQPEANYGVKANKKPEEKAAPA